MYLLWHPLIELFSLFDIVQKEEMGILCGHEGTVSRIVIQDEHMISSADDGTIRFFSFFDFFVKI